ncbi:MAG: NAD(P)H-dependent flavin oxidoreductase [Bacteroidota bacterium]
MKNLATPLCKQTGIQFPMIMAPMFLVSNEAMIKAAIRNGIMGVFPSLNYRKEGALKNVLSELKRYRNDGNHSGSYGVNLIVQQTNVLYKKHLAICIEEQVPFFITSLGNPKEVIESAHTYGGKVYCDVTNMEHARKCASLGADGFIAVCSGAGGHAGPHPASVFIPLLRKEFPTTPIIMAGGVADGHGVLAAFSLGASGVSVGTRFITCDEASVSQEYKQAIIKAGIDDIVMTERLSGTPCSVINTDYVKQIGLKQNFLERWMNKNPTTKKWFKMITQIRGMNKLTKSIQPGSYQTIWSAGQSSALINHIASCEEIISEFKKETEAAYKNLHTLFE